MKLGAHQIPKFDPFNMTGLPDHILTQVLDDYFFWYNDYAMREEFKLVDSYINKRRENHTPDPMLKEWLDQGLISQNQYDQVALLRGGPSELYSDIFSSPIGGYSVVPPDRMVPMSTPGSMDRLRHYEEGALDRTIKGGEFLPKVTAYAVGEDGVKRDLRDIDFMSILTGPVKGDYIPHGPIPETNLCPEVYGIEGEHLDGEVDRIMQKSGLLGENGMLDLFKVAALSKRNLPIEGEIVSPVMDLDENLNRRNYGILIRESLDSEGNVEYHLGEPKEKPLEGQIVDKGVLITILGPEDGAWQAGKEELSQAIENGELESTCDEGLPPVEPTPEEIADQEAAMQEAADGKLDYLLEGTQWDPKLRK